MTEQHNYGTRQIRPPAQPGHGDHGSHRWMIIACCVPMLLIVVLLMVNGAVSPGFLIIVLVTAIMVLMMRGMHGEEWRR